MKPCCDAAELSPRGPTAGAPNYQVEQLFDGTGPIAIIRAPMDMPVEEGDVIAEKYRVERVLGTGAMGVVVAAEHLQLRQRVALKFLSPRYSEDAVISTRFDREAQAACQIRSEHVARVIDVGLLESGSPYIVMEYLEGDDLGRVLDRFGQLPVEDAIDYVLQACEALAEAHALGIVHRDLKPENLFLTRRADGSALVKVLDFGISKHSSLQFADVSATSTTAIMGSPAYMSPEQVRSAKNVDERTDVWALGVILYELLTGRQVYEAENASAVLAMIVADPPPALRTHRSEAPEGLEAVILRCLEKDPAWRTRNVAELARELEPFAPERSKVCIQRIIGVLGGSEIREAETLIRNDAQAVSVRPPARTPARTPVRVKRKSKQKTAWIFGAGVGLAGVGFLIVTLLMQSGSQAQLPSESEQPAPTLASATVAAQPKPGQPTTEARHDKPAADASAVERKASESRPLKRRSGASRVQPAKRAPTGGQTIDPLEGR